MEYFGYRFIAKSPDLDATRRATSDHYANVAQWSQLLFVLSIPIVNIVLEALSHLTQDENRPDDNAKMKTNLRGKSSQMEKFSGFNRIVQSIEATLGREVVEGYGTYGQWMFGLGWSAWLAFLCIKDTAPGEYVVVCWSRRPS